jgi:hypothetical protein
VAQTIVQHLETIRFGSAKFEMGANAGALVNVGAIRSGVFEYTFDKISTKSDNAGVIRESAASEQAAFSADLMEVNFTNLGSFYAGVLTAASVAGAPVAITDEVHVLTGTTETALTYKMGAGTEVGSIVVTNAAGTTTLVRDCDYAIGLNASGQTTISRAYPAAICTTLVDITVSAGGKTYITAAGTFAALAIGDHIIVSGATRLETTARRRSRQSPERTRSRSTRPARQKLRQIWGRSRSRGAASPRATRRSPTTATRRAPARPSRAAASRPSRRATAGSRTPTTPG